MPRGRYELDNDDADVYRLPYLDSGDPGFGKGGCNGGRTSGRVVSEEEEMESLSEAVHPQASSLPFDSLALFSVPFDYSLPNYSA